MDDLSYIRNSRNVRRLNAAAYDADLHATAEQHLELIALKQAVRAGEVDIEVAIDAVNRLRAEQHDVKPSRYAA